MACAFAGRSLVTGFLHIGHRIWAYHHNLRCIFIFSCLLSSLGTIDPFLCVSQGTKRSAWEFPRGPTHPNMSWAFSQILHLQMTRSCSKENLMMPKRTFWKPFMQARTFLRCHVSLELMCSGVKEVPGDGGETLWEDGGECPGFVERWQKNK